MSRRFYDSGAAAAIIDDIEDGKYTNMAVVYGLLTQIINDLDGTAVAERADNLKSKLFN